MNRTALERRQVVFYMGAAALGLVVGTMSPGAGQTFDGLVWPLIGVLLYATFTQVSMTSIASAFRSPRFLAASLTGNFVVLPLAVWALIGLLPADDALRLGMLLVLLVPCTDWFITFSQLGQGDVAQATAVTPFHLVLQLLLLPAYLWIMVDGDVRVFAPQQIWPALVVVLAPLCLAAASEAWFRKSAGRERSRELLGWAPVPLLALVILLLTAANANAIGEALDVIPVVVAVSLAFLVIGLMLARTMARLFTLPSAQGRTLAFSFGTRNSFVVLPFALSLPPGWEIAALVIVMQSLIELLAVALGIWFVPRLLFPDEPAGPPERVRR